MPNPRRVQARRAKGYKAVHRPTRWGNPFEIPPYARAESMRLYEHWLDEKLRKDPAFLEPLIGFDSGCLWGRTRPATPTSS